LVCICPPSHPLARNPSIGVQDLLPHRLIGYPHDTPFGKRIEDLFAAHDEAPRIAMEVGSPQNACALVHVGAGIAVVDEFSLQAWRDARFKVLPLDKAPLIVADLVYLRTEPLSPAAQAFIRALRSILIQRELAVPFTED
ncbi:MAG: LysR substrate-binding domain-containing protein, partial [Burkholderiales bacterium]